MQSKRLRTFISRVSAAITVCVLLAPISAQALPLSTFAVATNNTTNGAQFPYYKPDFVASTTCSAGSTATVGSVDPGTIDFGNGVWGANSGIYVSGLQPPYTLEQWAISVLKNISKKSGVAESVLVTQTKVLSLVAFAQGEGGGFDGHNGTFNPLNTKLNHPDLHGANQGNAATDTNSTGFPTFDQGVEADTRALFSAVQKRIALALLNPATTPQDFVIAIAGDFYSLDGKTVINKLEAQYPGDKIWAAGSATGFIYDTVNNIAGNRDAYLKSKMGALNSVINNYAAIAGKVLDDVNRQKPPGTPAPLVFTATGLTGASTGGCAAAVLPVQAGTNGWDLPGEGPHPLTYYYSQVAEIGIRHKGYTDYYGPQFPYGSTTTIQKAGCGPTSVAMVVSNLTGKKVEAGGHGELGPDGEPLAMGDWFAKHGYIVGTGTNSNKFADHNATSAFAQKFGVTSKRLVTAQGRKLNADEAEVIRGEIRKGNFVIVSLGDGPLVTTVGDQQGAHITTIRAITDDGKFLFADSSDTNTKNSVGAFFQLIPLGSSRSPLSYTEIGTINTGVYVFEKAPATP